MMRFTFILAALISVAIAASLAPADPPVFTDYEGDIFKKDGEVCDHSSECEHELECIKKHMNDVSRCDCNLNDFYLVNGSCFAGSVNDFCDGYGQCKHRGLSCTKYPNHPLTRARCLCDSGYFFDESTETCQRSSFGKPCGVGASCDGFHSICKKSVCGCEHGQDDHGCVAPDISELTTCFTFNDCDTLINGKQHHGYACDENVCKCRSRWIELETDTVKNCTQAASQLHESCAVDQHCSDVIMGPVECAESTKTCECSEGHRGAEDMKHCLKNEEYVQITLWQHFWKQVSVYATTLYYKMSKDHTFFDKNIALQVEQTETKPIF